MVDRLVQAIVLVEDLIAARRAMEQLGLTVSEGGRHPGRGTANLIVAFGQQYLELLAIVDEDEARASPQGRPVLAAFERHGPGLARWSIEPSDIEATATRLHLPIERRQRVRPDGVVVRWRAVGVDQAWEEPWRAAFMAWEDPMLHPARSTSPHPNRSTGFATLAVDVPDLDAAVAWMGGAVPAGVALAVGAPGGPRQLTLTTPAGPLPVTRAVT